MRSGGVIHVLTGDRGSGKSTVCTRVAEEAVGRGLDVAGIITERTDPGQGSARRVVDLRSGEHRYFGSQASVTDPRRSARAAGAAAGASSDPLTPGWEFEAEVFDWADAVFARATPCDLFVVDELGPLELIGGRGWVGALPALHSRAFGLALVVCRPGLLDRLEQELEGAQIVTATVDSDSRDRLPADLVREVLRAVGA